jgi:hypothetical protein
VGSLLAGGITTHLGRRGRLSFVERLMAGVDGHEREIVLYLTVAPSPDEWEAAVSGVPVATEEGFALLPVGDFRGTATQAISDLAEWAIRRGVFSVSIWGPRIDAQAMMPHASATTRRASSAVR